MRHLILKTLAPVLGLALSACGGGGGSNIAPPTLPPPPPPPPPPPGSSAIAVFPDIETSTQFAALGYEETSPATAPSGDGFSVRFDADSGLYIFDLPSHAEAGFYASSEDANGWFGSLATTPSGAWPPMSIAKPAPTNPAAQLTYTSYAFYLRAGPMDDLPHGVVAFGIPTPASAIPVTGEATMTASVIGLSDTAGISGEAMLNFDFGAGTLSGHFNPVLTPFYGTTSVALGQYTFVNTVFGVGSTNFSGELSHSNPALGGSFNGLFTGPAAQEIMARWTATYVPPGTTGTPQHMLGVWVGSRQ